MAVALASRLSYLLLIFLTLSNLQWVAWSLTLRMGSERSCHGQNNFYFLTNPSCFFNSIFSCLDDNFHCWQLWMIKYTIFKHKQPPWLEVQNNPLQCTELCAGSSHTWGSTPQVLQVWGVTAWEGEKQSSHGHLREILAVNSNLDV